MTQDKKSQKYKVIVVGCGKMGSALIHGWISANLLETAQILDPEGIPESLLRFTNLFHVKHSGELDLQNIDLMILAIKPQIMDVVCAGIKDLLPSDLPILSIAAGKSISYFQKHLSPSTPIIRTMPNTPAAIGKGVTALYASEGVTKEQADIADNLMCATGTAIWLEREDQMNAVTALSGSGPAYIFHLMEAMAKAGEAAGLNTEQSMSLARETVIGSAMLASIESDTPASELRQNVTSPGGTTEAALNILMTNEYQDIMTKAILAAKERAEELSD